MKAIVAEKAGTSDVLTLKEIAKPDAKAGWVLIQVKAFSLNRAEEFTRQGDSPGVTFPRVLGIEAVGIVESAPMTCPPETGPTSVLGSEPLGGRQHAAKATLAGNHHPQAARG